jgi:SAM-dependent methyltransferase
MTEQREIRDAVRERYAAAARTVAAGAGDGWTQCCSTDEGIGASCYSAADLAGLPPEAVAASIGCANPVAVAELSDGEVVLDLGSGGGIDVLLSARRVGPTGKAYGLDMTDEMLELASANQARAGVSNVEFLKGNMEAIPLPNLSVDVIVSNCVIALSLDKDAVFSEAHRVLRPGGRLALADVIAEEEQPTEPLLDAAAWVACTGGALTERRYRSGLSAAGFVDVSIEHSHAVQPGFSSVIVQASKTADGVSGR